MTTMPKASHRHKQPAARRERRGFTAIEIAMVATVIAIFALLVLPIFRNRVDAAKIAAAHADLASLQKAETLAQADTGYYLRLMDLDNISGNPASDSANPNPPAGGIDLETPPMVYQPGVVSANRRALSLEEWRALAGPVQVPKFKGPYIAFQNSIQYSQARLLFPLLFRSATNDMRSPLWDIPTGGYQNPIFAGSAPNTGGNARYDAATARIPIDPWGNPYLFFPASQESPYQNNAIYSAGPNGLPGNGLNAGATTDYHAWLRNSPVNPDVLGGDDDISVMF